MARSKDKHIPLWWVDIPKPPDYSTPEAISERAREGAWKGGCPHEQRVDGPLLLDDTSSWCGACRWGDHVKGLRAFYRALENGGKPYRDFMVACAKGIPPITQQGG